MAENVINRKPTYEEIEEKLRMLENENKILKSVIENVPNPLFVKDANLNYIIFNEAFSDFLGKPKEEILNANVFDISPPELATIYNEADLKLKNNPEKQEYETVVKYADGSLHNIVFHKAVLTDNQLFMGIVGIMHDITERKQIEEKLKTSEEKYRLIFEFSNAAILLINKDGKYLNINSTYSTITGYTREELLNKPIGFITHPDDLQRIGEALKKMLSYQINTYSDNIRIFHKNGEIIWISLFAKTYINLKGDFEYIIVSFFDVSERMKIEQNFRKSEIKYRSLFEDAGDYIFVLQKDDVNGTVIVDVNAKAIEKHGYTREELIGMPISMLETEQFRKTLKERELLFHNIGDTVVFETEHIRKDGSTFPIEAQVKLMLLAEEQPFLLSIERDITERKQAENLIAQYISELLETNMRLDAQTEELNQLIQKLSEAKEQISISEEKYRLLIENQGEGIGIVDMNETFVFANPAAEMIFGVKHNDLINRNLKDFVTEDELAKVIIETKKRLQYEKSTYELEIIRPDGITINILVTATPQVNKDGLFTGTFGVFRDITERKKTEINLQKYSDELVQLNATKDKFISIIAHDLRNPFNSLIGFSSLLMKNIEKYDIQKIIKYVTLINETSTKTYQLLQNLLDWANAQKGVIPYNPEPIQLNSIVYQVIDVLLNTSKQKDINLTYSIPSDLYVLADRNMLNSIITNLITNAIKFTHKEGNVEVNAQEVGNMVEIRIVDDGVGMTESAMQKLFRIDMHHSTTGTGNERGTGLGLLLCKEFVEKHGGKIDVESEMGDGSTFKFTIPKVSKE